MENIPKNFPLFFFIYIKSRRNARNYVSMLEIPKLCAVRHYNFLYSFGTYKWYGYVWYKYAWKYNVTRVDCLFFCGENIMSLQRGKIWHQMDRRNVVNHCAITDMIVSSFLTLAYFCVLDASVCINFSINTMVVCSSLLLPRIDIIAHIVHSTYTYTQYVWTATHKFYYIVYKLGILLIWNLKRTSSPSTLRYMYLHILHTLYLFHICVVYSCVVKIQFTSLGYDNTYEYDDGIWFGTVYMSKILYSKVILWQFLERYITEQTLHNIFHNSLTMIATICI